MSLRPESESLMKMLRGGRAWKPPFWEVWFGMHEFFSRRYGENTCENRIRMADDLGMAIVLLGGVNTNLGFGRNEQTSSGLTRYSGGSLREISQMEERDLPDWDPVVDEWRASQGLIRDAGLVSWVVLPWCFHSVATSMGLRNFVVKLHRDRDFVERAFDIVEERNRLAIELVIRRVRPDVVLFDGDCSYKHGLMVDPGSFRALVFDRTRETVKPLKALGIPYVFHTDGKLDDVLPIIIGLGFSLVHGCERTANDLDDLVQRFGDDIVLAGNMDIDFLSRARPSEVTRETLEMLAVGGRKGRFVAACNTSPLDFIPEENYLAMARAIQSYRGARPVG